MVTGGGLGIGREVCKVLALEGCKVVVADILFEKFVFFSFFFFFFFFLFLLLKV